MCDDTPESTNASPVVKNVVDARDGKTYGVSKLADGNCWMVQNLAIEGGTELKTTDSNVPSNITLPANITEGTSSNYTSIQIINNKSGYDGNLYNWCAAIASVDNCQTTTNPYTSSDICPKGWRLPNGDTSTKSWYDLLNRYGYASGAGSRLLSAPLSLSYAGLYNSGYYNQGSYGYYWSRRVSSSSVAYRLYFYSSDTGPQSSDSKRYGFSVRCVYGS